MATRPVVTVYDLAGKKVSQIKTPAVFNAPIRSDVVTTVHTHMAKNRRQPYAVKYRAGMNHSAESWGTGRAVARIPRIAGSGTSRAGQAAFGNMCRKGRMFAPTKTWRKWHRKIAVNQRRYATVSALAATAVPALVMARGHAIGKVAEVPLVIDGIESIKKTKDAIAALKAVGAGCDIAKAKASRQVRSGVARLRNRAHTGRKSVLVIYANDDGLVKAFRNIPGVDICNVNRLNLLTLAPGATLGRFVVFSKAAAEALNGVFGTANSLSSQKKGYKLPRSVVTNADIASIINSDAVQSVLRLKKAKKNVVRTYNPLTNARAMAKLNPYAIVVKKAEANAQKRALAVRAAAVEAKKAGKAYPISAVEAKRRAAHRASAKSSKLSYNWINNGVKATPAQLAAAKFNVATYKKIAAKRTSTPAAAPAAKVVAPKVAARVEAAKALATATAKRVAAKAAKYN